MGAASPSPLSLSLSPAHLASPASLRPRCQSLFTNWLASLCSACGRTRCHRHSSTLLGTPVPRHPSPGLNPGALGPSPCLWGHNVPLRGSPTLAAHLTGVRAGGDTPHGASVSAATPSCSPQENLIGEQPPP